MSTPQPQQSTVWNGPAGHAWVRFQPLMDQILQPFADLLIQSIPSGATGHVLDIGCGTGSTTMAIASRLHPSQASITGVDISAPMLAVARQGNTHPHLSFIEADAETHAFPPHHFSRIISRFGVMFFEDPVAAFANLHHAAAPGAPLLAFAWRSPDENPFMTAAERTAAPFLPQLPPRRPHAPGQFGFASRDFVRQVLQAGGWHDIAITPLNQLCSFPAEHLLAYITNMGPVGQALATLDEPTRQTLIPRLLEAFSPFIDGPAVRFTAACWQITATAA